MGGQSPLLSESFCSEVGRAGLKEKGLKKGTLGASHLRVQVIICSQRGSVEVSVGVAFRYGM